MTLLEGDDPPAALAENTGGEASFLLVCDHAGRAIPRRLAGLGLPPGALDRHIGWDIGALDLGRRLAEGLDCGLVHQSYSRLVIDCNRAPDHPGSIVTVSDGCAIPGNLALTLAQAQLRRAEVFAPYHARLEAELDGRRARGLSTLLVCLHSFTPVMDGFVRPWHVGVLHLGDSPASDTLLEALRREPGLVVGDNEPYAMDGTDYTAPVHSRRAGIDAVELEVRQDLLQDPVSAQRIADLFIRLLPTVAP
jgi:predicted N-formylglutamate amidohydrolase